MVDKEVVIVGIWVVDDWVFLPSDIISEIALYYLVQALGLTINFAAQSDLTDTAKA